MFVCPKCGKQVMNPDAAFCTNCGTALTAYQAPVVSAPMYPTTPVRVAKLSNAGVVLHFVAMLWHILAGGAAIMSLVNNYISARLVKGYYNYFVSVNMSVDETYALLSLIFAGLGFIFAIISLVSTISQRVELAVKLSRVASIVLAAILVFVSISLLSV